MQVAGAHENGEPMKTRSELTEHHLSLEFACIEAPCQRAEKMGENIPVSKSCQAQAPTRLYKVNGQNKRLGLECYQIAST